jgi:rsbT co-antagonist protein RsbR
MAIETGSNRVTAILVEQRETISKQWIAVVVAASRGRMSTAETEHELLPILDALLGGLGRRVYDVNNAAYGELRALLLDYSRSRARQGFTPSETAVAIFALRDTVLSALQNGEVSAYADVPAFSRIIDDLGLLTFEAFVQTREAVITNQTEQLLELSTPVVKLWEGVVALPLVGTLDSARTQVVMETLLETLVSTGSEHAIIDITGVPAVDTQVAQHLLKTVVAARLMGAECVISGIRPQIAQTIVGLGIEFGDIATKASLADALRLTLERAGLQVVRKSERRP